MVSFFKTHQPRSPQNKMLTPRLFSLKKALVHSRSDHVELTLLSLSCLCVIFTTHL